MSDEKELLSKLPELSPLLAGPIMAFTLTILRALYYRKETRKVRIALEAAICACITVGIMAAVMIAVVVFRIPLPEEYAAFIAAGTGSFVAFIGVEHLHRVIIKYLNIKASGKQ